MLRGTIHRRSDASSGGDWQRSLNVQDLLSASF